MGLLFDKGATKNQKIVGTILLATMVTPFYSVFTRDFVSEPGVAEFSTYAAIILTGCLTLILIYLHAIKAWRPSPAWYKFSTIKKVVTFPLFLLFIFAILWANLAITVPQVYTSFFGVETVKQEILTKDRRSKMACRYRLRQQSVNAILFQYCITESFYNRLPDTPMESELLIKESSLGYIVKDVISLQIPR